MKIINMTFSIFKLILLTILFSSNIYAARQIRDDTLKQPAYGECINFMSSKWSDKCQNVEIFKYYGPRWKEMKQFFLDFQQAVKMGDKAKVASMIEYPIVVHYTTKTYDDPGLPKDLRTLKIYNKDAFIENYDLIFNENFKTVIINEQYKYLLVQPYVIEIRGSYSYVTIKIRCPKIGDDHNICTPYSIKIIHLNSNDIDDPND